MANRLSEIASLFFKLGVIGFGGPAAHLAAMDDEVVERRGWMTREQFLDLVGATNLIPGPNSTEMAIHIGYLRGGWPGLIVAGAAFILPAAVLTTLFAWMYVQYASLPELKPVLDGVKPAVLAIIFAAGWKLGAKAMKTRPQQVIALVAGVALVAGAPAIYALLATGILGMLWLRTFPPPSPEDATAKKKKPKRRERRGAWIPAAAGGGLVAALLMVQTATSYLLSGVDGKEKVTQLLRLGLFFFKVGLVLYGSGYVLLAYLESEVVDQFGWLTQKQLVDAWAVGQLTPGPILTTATFIGYVAMADAGPWASLAGAAIATLCIFLPSFLLVAIINPIVPKLRKSPWTGAFLDSVNAASMGLMGAVTLKLAVDVFLISRDPPQVNWISIILCGVACVLVFRWKVATFWIVLFGALAGLAVHGAALLL